jgi:flavin reductase (DIM6/NTAB) family NADH-FMN oxidoreductase RutF
MKTASSFSLFFNLLLCMTAAIAVDALQPTTTPPLLDSPTYSLATFNNDGSTNMNIITYATPVSILPDRVWSLGLYKETLTQLNLMQNPLCVLQLLREPQAELVRVLGGQSGRETDKREECAKLGFEWQELENCDGLEVLPGCAYYLKMRIQGGLVDAGSHLIVPFSQVEEMYTGDNGEGSMAHLSTSRLRELGIVTDQGRLADVEKTT